MQTLSEILRVVSNTCCKHALETSAPNTNISVAIPWNLQSMSWSRYCQWQANLPTHAMQHRFVLCCNCVVSRVWPHLRSWVTLLGWCVCHACTQCMHNNGSSFALGVETNHPYLSAALPTQALPLPPATPTKTISACPYFVNNHKKQKLWDSENLWESLRISENLLESLRSSEKLWKALRSSKKLWDLFETRRKPKKQKLWEILSLQFSHKNKNGENLAGDAKITWARKAWSHN